MVINDFIVYHKKNKKHYEAKVNFDICVCQMRDVIFTLYYFILETECGHQW